MKKFYFKCKFKADIVLNSRTSTEGKNNPLDYIPGNVFLGIVAKNYKKYIKDNSSFDVFHSSKVRFGDANLLINGKESFKIPFSYFYPKGEDVKKLLCNKSDAPNDKKIFIHHELVERNLKPENDKGNKIQLKQVRNGYINEDGNYLNIASVYHQKSAYDTDTRRSDDGKMFGYNAIKRGTEFLFSVDFDESISEDLQKQVINDLTGSQYIGKSKTAQYGKVEIREIPTPQGEMYGRTSQQEGNDNKEIIIYAKSNLAFIDKNGMLTAQPEFKNCKILWEKSQIRTRRYTPYNNARKTFDYERMVIEKGSVFVVEFDEGYDFNDFKNSIENGVGIYKNEGFGQVLINPKFLMELNPKFEPKEIVVQDTHPSQEGNEDKELIKWIDFKNEEKENRYKLLEDVNKFINKNWDLLTEPSLSQWGQIRSITASHIVKEDRKDKNGKSIYDKLFNDNFTREEDKGFCVHGASKDHWKNLLKKDEFKKYHYEDKFLELLAIEVMRKIKADNKKGGSND